MAGLRVVKVLPLTASTHWLLMKSFVNFTSGRDILLLSDDPDQMQVALLLLLLIYNILTQGSQSQVEKTCLIA